MERSVRGIDDSPSQNQELDKTLLDMTDEDPTGLRLMRHLCELVEARDDWNQEEKLLTYESIELMDTVHGHDDRGNSDAYITHPLRVAITLLANHVPPRLVAAGLLHDTVEDKPKAVIKYILAEMASSEDEELTSIARQSIPIGAAREKQIEHALLLMQIFPTYQSVTTLVSGVTNRAYPPQIDDMTDATEQKAVKHAYRAEQIKKHIDQSAEEAILKFADTYDNIRGLARHEVFTTDPNDISYPKKVRNLEKLVEKYTLMIDTWKNLETTRPAIISAGHIAVCKQRLDTIREWEPLRKRRRVLARPAVTEVITLAT